MMTTTNEGTGAVIAVGAMVFAVAAAAVFGSGAKGGARELAPAARVEAALQDVEQGKDHIAAGDLCKLLLARSDVALIDLRPADDYAQFHLPGAVRLDAPAAAGAEGEALCKAHAQVVLYSNGPAHPGQAWVELRRKGHDNARVLDGGLAEFQQQILTPPSLAADVDEATAKAAAATFALRRAFFLGSGAPSRAAGWATDPQELTAPTVVSAAWVQQRLGKLAILDVRERAADYAALHLPGAVHVPVASLRSKHGDRDLMLLPVEQLAARFGALGIERTTPVVLYGDEKLQDATMAAMAFLATGHRALAILEGGIVHWATQRQALVADAPTPKVATYTPASADAFAIAIDDLAKAVQQQSTKVLDVRPPEFYRGDKSTEARPGHIPGAVNRPFQQDVQATADGAFWQPKAKLAADYAGLGLRQDDALVVHCRTGHTASESFFVLRYLLGYQQVKWFNGSWTEWAEHKDLPAATGAAK